MFKWLRNRFIQEKQQATAELRQLLVRPNNGMFIDKSYWGLSTQGYENNIIANHCINAIATAVADIPIITTVNGTEQEPEIGNLAYLLTRPNAYQSYNTFMTNATAYRLISGNTYFHALKGDITNKIFQIQLYRPDLVYIDVVDGIPKRYIYNLNGKQIPYPIDRDTGLSDILHIKTFSPTDELYGYSALSAAMMAIGQHNQASIWNQSLLENSSRPDGIVSMKDRGDNAANLTAEQMQSIKSQINSNYGGSKNAGKLLVFNHDMQWQSLSFSPMDMAWLEGKQANARDICLAFNYPSILLGYPQTSSYNNISEAKLQLYEEMVVPTLNIMLDELAYWLSKITNTNIELEPDLDQVSALMPRRQIARENARLDLAAGIISTNEARDEIGYDEIDGGDEIMIPAGKLPLNFDVTGLNDKQYFDYLIKIGFTKSEAFKLCGLTKGMNVPNH